MEISQTHIQHLVLQLRHGDPEALGELLDQQRGDLKALAERVFEGILPARLDASNLLGSLTTDQGFSQKHTHCRVGSSLLLRLRSGC